MVLNSGQLSLGPSHPLALESVDSGPSIAGWPARRRPTDRDWAEPNFAFKNRTRVPRALECTTTLIIDRATGRLTTSFFPDAVRALSLFVALPPAPVIPATSSRPRLLPVLDPRRSRRAGGSEPTGPRAPPPLLTIWSNSTPGPASIRVALTNWSNSESGPDGPGPTS